jgi:CheY-like chemotaxis protein
MYKEIVHSSPEISEAFCKTLAHDLNNILSLILGNISLAMGRYWHEEKPLKTLSKVEHAALQARELAQQLTIYTQYGTMKKAECDVAALLREAVRLALLEASGPIDFSLPGDLCPIKVDMEQLHQVLRSLIVHGLKVMEAGGVVHIAAGNDTVKKGGDLPLNPGKYVKISIGHHYPGRGTENLSHSPEGSAPPKTEHIIVSLNTVYCLMKKVLESHGGCLTKEVQTSRHLNFYLYLPAQSRKKAPKSEALEKQEQCKGRILVMDDEEMVRANVGMILDFLGYETEFASEGAQALDLYAKAQADRRPFDAVLVDLTIHGGLNGRETASKLLETDPQAKTIIFSGNVEDPAITDFASYGFKGIIRKPYTVDDFNKVLNLVLN